jgi:hypothetical protein
LGGVRSINPLILEIFPPVTRVKIFWMSAVLLKIAAPSLGTENSWKLWNKLLSLTVPPSILQTLHPFNMREFTGRVLSGTIWAIVGWLKTKMLKIIPLMNKNNKISFIFFTKYYSVMSIFTIDKEKWIENIVIYLIICHSQ